MWDLQKVRAQPVLPKTAWSSKILCTKGKLLFEISFFHTVSEAPSILLVLEPLFAMVASSGRTMLQVGEVPLLIRL